MLGQLVTKQCVECRGTFRPARELQIYCSKICARETDGSRRFKRLNLSTATVGALGELEVCVDLLKRGYAVFRAVSPSCPFDLVIFKNGDYFKVEVTTGHIGRNGKIAHAKKDKDRFDILAICTERGIHYQPGFK